jgi:hypothetical protein
MARQIVYTDDLDGSPDAELVTFAVGGVAYEIDLGPANRERFDKSLAEFIAHARKGEVTVSAPPKQAKRTAGLGNNKHLDREQATAIRDWARGQGIKVAERGRIPSSVLDAFNEEHGTSPTMPRPENQRRLNDEANRILKQQPKDEAPRPDLPTAEEMAALHEESKAAAPPRPAKAAPPALFSAPEQPAVPEDEPSDPQPQIIEITKAGIIAWMKSKGMQTEGVRYLSLLKAYKQGHPGVEVRYVKDSA